MMFLKSYDSCSPTSRKFEISSDIFVTHLPKIFKIRFFLIPIQFTGLAALFKPPSDITFVGTLEKAKIRGKRLKKWLLVNIQVTGQWILLFGQQID